MTECWPVLTLPGLCRSAGGQVIPTNTSARVLLGVWWLMAITIIASYTGRQYTLPIITIVR